MKALYLIGEPGVGKTTLMDHMLTRYARSAPVRLAGLLWGEPLSRGPHLVGVHLGRPRPGFGGTDALGMAVHPDALRWATEARLPERVFAEGQRLATTAFLAALAARGTVTVGYLMGEQVAAARRAGRGSTQAESFVKGARTRAANLADNPPPGVVVVRLDAARPVDALAKALHGATHG